MGLDITLGAVVLLAAVRGWFKGFFRQAITLGALVGCVYLADPLRDLGRPYARSYFPSIAPDLLDRLLWWTSAVVSYLVTSGIALAVLKSTRKRPYGDPEPNRGDQGAGFTLGAVKGLIVASFLCAGVTRFAPGRIDAGGFLEDQTRKSYAQKWCEQYRPATVLWESPPVQSFVARIKTRGMWVDDKDAPPQERGTAKATETPKPTPPARPTEAPRTASTRPKTLSLPPTPDPSAPDFQESLEEGMRQLGLRPE